MVIRQEYSYLAQWVRLSNAQRENPCCAIPKGAYVKFPSSRDRFRAHVETIPRISCRVLSTMTGASAMTGQVHCHRLQAFVLEGTYRLDGEHS